MSSLALATDALDETRAALASAEARAAAAREAFQAAPASDELAAASALKDAERAVEVETLRLKKREGAVTEALAAERAEGERRRVARVAELRGARPALLSSLSEAMQRVLTARRAFAAAVGDVVRVVADENERAAELRALGQVEPATDIDVVRLAIGQLIDRDAPSEHAQLEQLPTTVVSLADSILSTENFESALVRLRNEFVAAAGPTVADFCAPQPFISSGATLLATELNAKGAVELLREIEENQS